MDNEVLKIVANLATYLDKNNHKEESHGLDTLLFSLAQQRVLNIDGVDYTSAAAAWKAYDGSVNYRSFADGLGLDAPVSEEIKAALDQYFGESNMPGNVLPAGGEEKDDELKWYDPRDWPEYIKEMRPEYKGTPAHIQKGLEGVDYDG